MLLGLAHGLFDVVLVHARAGGDGDLVLLAGGAVLRGDVDDAVRVDVESHLDLWHAAGSRREALEVELPEPLVVPRHGPLALEDVDFHAGLPISRGGEDHALPGRDGGVARDERRRHAAERLDGERQRGHVEEEDVLHLAGEDAALDGSADGDHFIRVHRPVGLLAEEFLH